MATRIISRTGSYPTTQAEAKLHLKVDHSDDDDLIDALIDAAYEMAEKFTGLFFKETEVEYQFAKWSRHLCIAHLPIDKATPANFVLEYYDENDAQQTVSNANYKIDSTEYTGVLLIDPDYDLPELSEIYIAPITLTVTCGYTTGTPSAIKQAALLMIGDMYENREDRARTMPMASKYLLSPYRLWQT